MDLVGSDNEANCNEQPIGSFNGLLVELLNSTTNETR